MPSFGVVCSMCVHVSLSSHMWASFLGREEGLLPLRRHPCNTLRQAMGHSSFLLVRSLGQRQALSVAVGGPELGGWLGTCRESLPDVAAPPGPSEGVSVRP